MSNTTIPLRTPMPGSKAAQEKDKLELLIDATSLSDVLDAIAQIAFEKSEHIASNWQDTKTAKAWEMAGGLIAKAASKIDL